MYEKIFIQAVNTNGSIQQATKRIRQSRASTEEILPQAQEIFGQQKTSSRSVCALSMNEV